MPPVVIGDDGRMVLSPTAQKLFYDVSLRWELTPPAEAQLRVVCEQKTTLETIDRILAKEGMLVNDMKGAAKAHPLALLARDLRNNSSNGLQRLMSNLG